MVEPEGQLLLEATFYRSSPANMWDTWYGAWYSPTRVSILENRTLELRVDLVSANQEDAFAWLDWDSGVRGYALVKDRDEIYLLKYGGGRGYFFWEDAEVKNHNVILVLSFTYRDTDLVIRTAVSDKDQGNSVLWSRTVVDTSASDQTLPNLSRRGMQMSPDVGPPWVGSGSAFLALWQHNISPNISESEVVFDNLCAYEYEPVRLSVQRGGTLSDLLLTWPVTSESWSLENSPLPDGPWSKWSGIVINRQNDHYQAQTTPSDQSRFFRLRSADNH